jgi:hypothetical protein
MQIITAQLRKLFGPISAFLLSNLMSFDVNAMEIETVVQRSPKVSVLSAVGEVGAEPTSGPGVSSVHVNNVRPGLQRQTGFYKKRLPSHDFVCDGLHYSSILITIFGTAFTLGNLCTS